MTQETYHARSDSGELLQVIHHEDDRFYELLVDGLYGGLLVYGKAGDRLVFTHTFIADGYRGRGLSNVMIQNVLDDIQANGQTITNYCPVLDRFIEKHPEYVALIDEHNPGTWSRQDHGARVAAE
jgi:hypothetical protein